jgi:hypothetical protein
MAEKVVITTIETVLGGRESLARLSQREASVAVALKIMGLSKFLTPFIAGFVARRHAILSANGTAAGENRWKLDPEQRAGFESEIRAAAEEEIRIPLSICLTLSDLAEVKISAGDLERVAYLIRDLD